MPLPPWPRSVTLGSLPRRHYLVVPGRRGPNLDSHFAMLADTAAFALPPLIAVLEGLAIWNPRVLTPLSCIPKKVSHFERTWAHSAHAM
jgi:hypothetical protein